MVADRRAAGATMIATDHQRNFVFGGVGVAHLGGGAFGAGETA